MNLDSYDRDLLRDIRDECVRIRRTLAAILGLGVGIWLGTMIGHVLGAML